MEEIVSKILDFNRRCCSKYIDEVAKDIKGFPVAQKYLFPDGNIVRPVMSVSTAECDIMLIGAFPSARFEMRNNHLIPVANNLSPFSQETYFDGRMIRKQASREILDNHYFPALHFNPEDIWITDLVKVYLFPKDHIENCRSVNNKIDYVNTHTMFERIAASEVTWKWKSEEIELCNPKVIITLGEVCARILSGDIVTPAKELLDGSIRPFSKYNSTIKIAHLGHPEIFRRNASEWREHILRSLDILSLQLKRYEAK